MKQLNNYIQEKFEINSKTKPIDHNPIIEYIVRKYKCELRENSPLQKSNDEFIYDFKLSTSLYLRLNQIYKAFKNDWIQQNCNSLHIQDELNKIVSPGFKIKFYVYDDGFRLYIQNEAVQNMSKLKASYIYLDFDINDKSLIFFPGKQIKINQITDYKLIFNESINILDYCVQHYTK